MIQTIKKWICKPIYQTDENLEALRETQRQIDSVRSRFDMQSDGDLIEACIFELDALQARHRFLMRQIRQKKQEECVCQQD